MAEPVEFVGNKLGGVSGVGRVETLEQLAALVARMAFRATVSHAGIHCSWYDPGCAPTQPQAPFGLGPTGVGDTQETWMRTLPPYDIAVEVVEAFYPLRVRIHALGGQGGSLAGLAVAEPLAAS